MNMEIGTETAHFQKGIHKWDFLAVYSTRLQFSTIFFTKLGGIQMEKDGISK
jgi:hypothetical protein